MNRKTALDIAIFLSCITGLILSYAYLDNPVKRDVSMTVLSIVGILSTILAMADAKGTVYADRNGAGRKEISEILLLSEEGHVTATWDIYGKTAVVFGKDERENQVDINLKNIDYFGTVDGEHAVMNYSNVSWYIEDLDSENGTNVLQLRKVNITSSV